MNDDYSELVISQSLLDDIFVVRYLQDLSREAVVVYLWLNMTAGTGEFDEDSEIMGGNMAGDWYITCVVAEETLLVCYSTPDKSAKKVMKNALADLGYEFN